jgi:hypothetical protein
MTTASVAPTNRPRMISVIVATRCGAIVPSVHELTSLAKTTSGAGSTYTGNLPTITTSSHAPRKTAAAATTGSS